MVCSRPLPAQRVLGPDVGCQGYTGQMISRGQTAVVDPLRTLDT